MEGLIFGILRQLRNFQQLCLLTLTKNIQGIYLLCVQLGPSQPSAQTQVYDSIPSRQLAPFLQLWLRQLSISEHKKCKSQDTSNGLHDTYHDHNHHSHCNQQAEYHIILGRLKCRDFITYFHGSGSLCNLWHIYSCSFLERAIHMFRVRHKFPNLAKQKFH